MLVRCANVTGVFRSSAAEWGHAHTGDWRHFAVAAPAKLIFKSATLTAGQAMAEKHHEFKTVLRALEEFSPSIIEQALKILRSESLWRGEAVLGQAEWLAALHAARAVAHGDGKKNV